MRKPTYSSVELAFLFRKGKTGFLAYGDIIQNNGTNIIADFFIRYISKSRSTDKYLIYIARIA